MKLILLYCLTLITCITPTLSWADSATKIRYIESKAHPDPKQSYFVDLLTLTLEASKDKFGAYQLQPVSDEMAQGRASMMLRRNELIDIHWRMTSKKIETDLQAVYFPLLKGLMGYRIFIIRQDEQTQFKQLSSLAQLQKLPLGQGHNWPDSEILVANDFNVITGYDIYLLTMLKRQRFDYFPRALHEPWLEIANDKSLVVEQTLMLQYPAPMYFFVNKKNQALKARLNYGLTKLLNNGQFEQFFSHHPITSGILKKANVKQRKTYQLLNPLLSENSKNLLKDERLWLDINQ